jgi:hypothetical protein
MNVLGIRRKCNKFGAGTEVSPQSFAKPANQFLPRQREVAEKVDVSPPSPVSRLTARNPQQGLRKAGIEIVKQSAVM